MSLLREHGENMSVSEALNTIAYCGYVGIIAAGIILGPSRVKSKVESGVESAGSGVVSVGRGIARTGRIIATGANDLGNCIERWYKPVTPTATVSYVPTSVTTPAHIPPVLPPAIEPPTPPRVEPGTEPIPPPIEPIVPPGAAPAPPMLPEPAPAPAPRAYVSWNPRTEEIRGMLFNSYILKDDSEQNPKGYSFGNRENVERFVRLANKVASSYHSVRGIQLPTRLATNLAAKIDTVPIPSGNISAVELSAAEAYLAQIQENPERFADELDKALGE